MQKHPWSSPDALGFIDGYNTPASHSRQREVKLGLCRVDARMSCLLALLARWPYRSGGSDKSLRLRVRRRYVRATGTYHGNYRVWEMSFETAKDGGRQP
ncbi:hypothetical protein IG631_00906 [Alternaria alternata]|jgi:hypothetical protein|nr:hypothetical protein IG631_00906 [Alternaria alternata]